MTTNWPQTIPAEARLKIVQVSLFALFCHIVILIIGFATFEPHYPVPTKLIAPSAMGSNTLSQTASPRTSVWYHWDALWFVHISQYGYSITPSPFPDIPETNVQNNVAFTPGLPIVMHLLQSLGISPWAGVLVLNTIADFLAKLGLGLIAFRLTHSAAVAAWSILLQLCWPWHFFILAPYQEALGLACLIWAIECGLRGRFTAGFLLSFLAGAFRLNAVGLFAGLALGSQLALYRTESIRIRLKWLWLCSGALMSWLLLNCYFYLKFGDATVGMTAQLAWDRSSPSLLNIPHALFEPFAEHLGPVPGSTWLHWATAWLVVISIPITWQKLGPMWAMPVAVMTAQCLATGTCLSFGRFTLLAIPYFITAAIFAEKKPRWASFICLSAALLQFWLLFRYGQDLFAG